MALHVENPKNLNLPQAVEQVLQTLFANYQTIVIRRQFGSSLSGGYVLEVRPITKQGRPELPTVAKIASISLIQKEWMAYQSYILNYLPEAAEVIGKPVLLSTIGWGGLRYKLVGWGQIEIMSLYEYCQRSDVTAEDIQQVSERLFDIMHALWGHHQTTAEFFVKQSYDRLLPVNLLLKHTETPANSRPHSINPNIRLRQPLKPGDWVQLSGFVVAKVDMINQTITLTPPETVTAKPYYVRVKSDQIHTMTLRSVGEMIDPLDGQVMETRDSRLQAEMMRAFPSEVRSDKTTVNIQDEVLPNPVPQLDDLLNSTRSVRQGTVHGDFNLENILVDPQTRTVRVIDFAEAREDHILHDCLRLETEVITKITADIFYRNPTLSIPKTLLNFFWALHQITFLGNTIEADKLYPEVLHKPFTLLRLIRQRVRGYLFNFNDCTEYYQTLTIYLLGALKFRNLDHMPQSPIPKQVAFWSAVVNYQLYQTPNGMPPSFERIINQPLSPVLVENLIDNQLDLTGAEKVFREGVRQRYDTLHVNYVPVFYQAFAPFQRQRSSRRGVKEAREYEAVDLVTATEKFACAILLGAPGAGKSTALAYTAYQLAENEVGYLPLLLNLSEFEANWTVETFIKRSWGGALKTNYWGASMLASYLEDYLQNGQLFILFDGLNEMPRERYQSQVQALHEFIEAWASAGNRFLITCRTLDYDETMVGVPHLELLPFTDSQINQFLINKLDSNDAQDLADMLGLQPSDKQTVRYSDIQQLDERQGLNEMARNPYLLTLMMEIFLTDGTLTQNRSGLMQRFIEILLSWAKEHSPRDKWLDADILQASLSTLAFEMRKRTRFGTRVKTVLVKTVMPTTIQLDPDWPAVPSSPDTVLKLAADAHILEMPPDLSSVKFYHFLLQEYFAARQMIIQDPTNLIPLWRWPWLETEMPTVPQDGTHHLILPPPPATGWEETTILAAGLVENDDQFLSQVLAVNPVLAARCLYEGKIKVDSQMLQRVFDALIQTVASPEIALRVRIAAGQALGRLGDPRLGEMVTIPAGPFLMGVDHLEVASHPQHEVVLAAYQIGKYPVTNTEYQHFRDAGGYEDIRWWTEMGWAQKNQEDWSAQPRYYGRFAEPNAPVVGISWYEAVAYCRWLSAETRETYRLPTEAEWEKAARGTEGSLYPWGNRFDPQNFNGLIGTQKVMTTTPVGIYPGGRSPYEVFDCIGNVWEWCTTHSPIRLPQPYPYQSEIDEWNESYLTGNVGRIRRGGSWREDMSDLSCINRTLSRPESWFSDRGFRLVRVIP